MRPLVRITALTAALVVPLALAGGVLADQDKKAADDAATETAARDWSYPQEACFGDRYESDADLNEGNEVSIDEILALINPPRT